MLVITWSRYRAILLLLMLMVASLPLPVNGVPCVTTNGSNPSEQNFLHYGRAPLSFRIDKSCRIKAIAINKEMGSSVMVQQDFNIYTPCGVGLLLKKVCATHAMKRTCMTPSTNMCH